MKSKHRCPPWCHRCPDMVDPNGTLGIMPMCCGSIHRDDLFGCYCDRPKLKERDRLEKKVAALEKRLREVEKKLEAFVQRQGKP